MMSTCHEMDQYISVLHGDAVVVAPSNSSLDATPYLCFATKRAWRVCFVFIFARARNLPEYVIKLLLVASRG